MVNFLLDTPIIISGSFLETMKNLSFSVRTEIKDLYFIILQGIDGLFFHDGVLKGKDPFEFLNTINEICSLCEKRVDYGNLFIDILCKTKKPMLHFEATASSAVKSSFNVQAKVVLCLSDLGVIPAMASKYKPYCPLLCCVFDYNVAQCLGLYRGVFCNMIDYHKYKESGVNGIIEYFNDELLENKIVCNDSNIILINGIDNENEMKVFNPKKKIFSKENF